MISEEILSCNGVYGDYAKGRIVFYEPKKYFSEMDSKQIKIFLRRFSDGIRDEYLTSARIEQNSFLNTDRIKFLSEKAIRVYSSIEFFRLLYSKVLRKNQYIVDAFIETLKERFSAERDRLIVEEHAEEILDKIKYFRKRFISLIYRLLVKMKYSLIKEDFILYVSDIRREIFNEIPANLKGVIFKNKEGIKLARIYGQALRITIATSDEVEKEYQSALLDVFTNKIIVGPFRPILRKVAKYDQFKKSVLNNKDPLFGSKLKIYTTLSDKRELKIINKSDWFNGICAYRSEFDYASRGIMPKFEDLVTHFIDVFKGVGTKELMISALDFNPEITVDNIKNGYTDLHTFDQLSHMFNEHLQAIAKASIITKKSVKILVPMLRLGTDLRFWIEAIKGAFQFENAEIPQIGVIIETESAFEFYEDYTEADFIVIGLDNLLEELMDKYDRYDEKISYEDFKYEMLNKLVEYHQYLREYRTKKRHILSGTCLANKQILYKLLKKGIFEFSIPLNHFHLVEQTLIDHMNQKGKYIGVAKERKIKREHLNLLRKVSEIRLKKFLEMRENMTVEELRLEAEQKERHIRRRKELISERIKKKREEKKQNKE
jgi:phosphotransferase system enzyme I (PtsI)